MRWAAGDRIGREEARRSRMLASISEPRTTPSSPRRSGAMTVCFTVLVERYRRELQVHCYRMVGSFTESEDLAQETFLRAWRRLETFEGRSTFRTWLYGSTASPSRSSGTLGRSTLPSLQCVGGHRPDLTNGHGRAIASCRPDCPRPGRQLIPTASAVSRRLLQRVRSSEPADFIDAGG